MNCILVIHPAHSKQKKKKRNRKSITKAYRKPCHASRNLMLPSLFSQCFITYHISASSSLLRPLKNPLPVVTLQTSSLSSFPTLYRHLLPLRSRIPFSLYLLHPLIFRLSQPSTISKNSKNRASASPRPTFPSRTPPRLSLHPLSKHGASRRILSEMPWSRQMAQHTTAR